MLRWRVVVLGAWALVLVLGALSAAHLSGRLTTSLAVPGSSSARANVILERDFHENVEGTFTVVVPTPAPDDARVRAIEHAVALAARSSIPQGRVVQARGAADLVYVNVSTPYSLRRAADFTAALRQALTREHLTGALVTGAPALESDLAPVLGADLARGEILALALALVLLVAVLGLCGALIIPFLVAAASAAGALSVVYLLAAHWLMVLYIPNVVELIGLGLAIDYALLFVHRFRAEVAVAGTSTEDAVVRTMHSAGRTVLTSGAAVAVGLASLVFVPVPFMRSLGAAALCVPLVAMLAALTIQPVLLSLLGPRGVRPVGPAGLLAARDPLTGLFATVTRRVLARPRAVATLTTAALLGLCLGTLWLSTTPASETAVPPQLPSAHALALVRTSVGPGIATPLEIVIDTGRARAVSAPDQRAAQRRLVLSILNDHEAVVIGAGARAPYVDATGRFARVLVVGRHDFGASATQRLVRHIATTLIAAARFPAGTRVTLGGAPGQGVDFLDAVYGSFAWIVAAAMLLAFLVLARAFRSLTLALVAVVLDLLSVGAAYGVTVVVFRGGLGRALLGTYQVSQLEGWVPVFAFALLFGLSSDYEVFIVSRVRELHDAGADTAAAILGGVARTGGVVSAAAAIMVGALAGLVFGRVAGLQELGIAVTLGVLIDATIVRGLLLPAVMALLGDRCWWLPRGAARLLRVEAPPTRGGASTDRSTTTSRS